MSYNIEEFIRFLGNPLNETQRTNIMYFLNGRQRSVGIKEVSDIKAAEKFVKLNDGRRQLYININPCGIRCSGKPKDSDIPEVKNLYIDIDAVKASGMKKHPASDKEIYSIPIDEIMDFVTPIIDMIYKDFTGNGYRIIAPVSDATQIDERNFVCLLHSKFPDYIDTNVIDMSRITGVPGTMNVKEEILGRPNRIRTPFPQFVKRMEVCLPIYTEAQREIIGSMKVKHRPKKESRVVTTPLTPEQLQVETQELLNRYILRCSKTSPWVLHMIELGPPDGQGFMFDGFMASEIYNKVGNYARVFATIMKAMWGEDYSPRATEKAWFDVVDNDIRPWSKEIIKEVFGTKIFEEK